VTEVQRSLDLSTLEGQVTSAADIQASKVSGKQPRADMQDYCADRDLHLVEINLLSDRFFTHCMLA